MEKIKSKLCLRIFFFFFDGLMKIAILEQKQQQQLLLMRCIYCYRYIYSSCFYFMCIMYLCNGKVVALIHTLGVHHKYLNTK